PAADRNLAARLPKVELAERARPIGAALKGARPRQKQRPHLAQVVVEDRLATGVALLLEQLPHPLTGKPRLRTQQPVHLVAERIELRRPRRTPITRRLNRAQRPSDRVTAVARAPDDLLDRQPLHEIQATDLRPLLHPDHNLLLARTTILSEALDHPGRHHRRRQGGQLSTGLRGSVFNRRRYARPGSVGDAEPAGQTRCTCRSRSMAPAATIEVTRRRTASSRDVCKHEPA